MHKKEFNPSCINWYNSKTCNILKGAQIILVDLYRHHSQGIEGGHACITTAVPDMEINKGLKLLLMDILVKVHSEVAKLAQHFAAAILKTDNTKLLANPVAHHDWMIKCIEYISDIMKPFQCFLHEHNGEQGNLVWWYGNTHLEKFHLEFWYTNNNYSPIKGFQSNFKSTLTHMYALSATALLCGLHCYAFCTHLNWLNLQGIQMFNTGERVHQSLKKVNHIFLPNPDSLVVYEAGPSSTLGLVSPFHMSHTESYTSTSTSNRILHSSMTTSQSQVTDWQTSIGGFMEDFQEGSLTRLSGDQLDSFIFYTF
ncbi:hypothetical protein J3A83DRAFT_4399007 [Scleroderma citrinum]